MRVDELKPAPGSVRSKRRVGRGIGGHGGKTAGRGTKGQRARNTVARGFEGGQMPLKQRVPKLKGFNNPFRVEYTAVNLHQLAKLGVAKPDIDRLICPIGLSVIKDKAPAAIAASIVAQLLIVRERGVVPLAGNDSAPAQRTSSKHHA